MVDGEIRKIVMHADRNGFFYVIDRVTGELLRANKFIKYLNWAEGIDMETGRPIESELTKNMRATGEKVQVYPSAFGGKNWMPMSFNPKTGLAYANTLEMGMGYKPVEPKFVKGTFYTGIDFAEATLSFEEGQKHGVLRGIDPLTGVAKWEADFEIASFSGTMTTGGNLVFTGALTGEFMAFDATNGKQLWQFKTGSGIIGQPVTWESEGVQYVTVLSGTGGVYPNFFPLMGAAHETVVDLLNKTLAGGSVWTFALMKE